MLSFIIIFFLFSLPFEIDASQVENPWGDREVAKGCRGAESLNFFKTVATSRARTGKRFAGRKFLRRNGEVAKGYRGHGDAFNVFCNYWRASTCLSWSTVLSAASAGSAGSADSARLARLARRLLPILLLESSVTKTSRAKGKGNQTGHQSGSAGSTG